MRHLTRRGFTLVELLIVIGIVVLLLTVLLPALNKARQQAQQVQCASNERQIVMAMLMYADSNRGWLPLPVVGNLSYQLGGKAIWMGGVDGTNIQNPIPGQYDYQNGVLWPFIGTKDPFARERLFTCPADPEPRQFTDFNNPGAPQRPRNFSYNFNSELYVSSQWGFMSDGGHFVGIGVPLTRIKGAEHKILVVEEQSPAWEACDLFRYMVDFAGIPNPFSTRHYHCANMGLADGHVELLGPNDLPATTQTLTMGQMRATIPQKYNYYIALPH